MAFPLQAVIGDRFCLSPHKCLGGILFGLESLSVSRVQLHHPGRRVFLKSHTYSDFPDAYNVHVRVESCRPQSWSHTTTHVFRIGALGATTFVRPFFAVYLEDSCFSYTGWFLEFCLEFPKWIGYPRAIKHE